METQVMSPYAVLALEALRASHYRGQVVGYGPVPTEPIYRDGWWIEEMREVPAEAKREVQKRLDALKRAGVNITGMIIAHEAPRLLSAPKDKPKSTPAIVPEIQTSPVQNTGGAAGLATGVAVAGAATMALVGGVMVAVVAGLIWALAAGLDPAIIVRCEDGTWVEILNYQEV